MKGFVGMLSGNLVGSKSRLDKPSFSENFRVSDIHRYVHIHPLFELLTTVLN